MNRVRPQDKVEVAFLEKKDFQYLYQEGDDYVFMDSETFDQYPLPKDLLGDQMKYLKENDNVKLTMYEGKPLDIELPATVELKVTETDPSLKGATAAAQYKPATMETGTQDSGAAVHRASATSCRSIPAPVSTSAERSEPVESHAPPLVTLTTDFGEGSSYVAAMKGAILSINPAARILDLTHSIPPQDLTAASIFLADVLPCFPSRTIHVVVVDPGVGTSRAPSLRPVE